MFSLNTRVLIAACVVLAAFFGLAGFTLDRMHKESVEQDIIERLQGHIYALIAAAELDENGLLFMPKAMPDTRFSDSSSGVYAQVSSNTKYWVWRSRSIQQRDLPFATGLARTEHIHQEVYLPNGQHLGLLSYGVVWSDSPDPNQAYTFSVAQDLSAYDARLAKFRSSLWGTLGIVALLLLIAQWSILRWGLAPLKNAAGELMAIEEGRQARLKGKYPPELQGLTGNINALLSHQQEHLERYRRTLGDLAHSLKTPLAILQSAAESREDRADMGKIVLEQVERMNQLTGYQLQRAATSGWTVLAAPVAVRGIVEKMCNGLQKVYADKRIQSEIRLGADLEFHGDEGDFMEVLGNLVDNAFKYCRGKVRISGHARPGPRDGDMDLFLQVEDDGLGIPPEMVRYVMQRGRRADSEIAGHGIGLSIVRDIVQLYGGTLEIGESPLGGAAVHVWFPGGPKG